MNVFELEGVTRAYDSRPVLAVEGLEIREGLRYAVMGPSGAGKTTLLRLLNLLERPDSGQVRAFGRDPWCLGRTERLALRRRMTMVFQRPHLFEGTVEENVAYGLMVRGVPWPRRRERVRAALARVGLEDMARAHVGGLSGGEAQRAALARAMVLDPEVLLLDEPTANLDPANVSLIERAVLELNEERGTTVIMVTHNVFQAKRLALRALFLHRGTLIEEGPAAEVFSSPRSPLTRDFIEGRMVY